VFKRAPLSVITIVLCVLVFFWQGLDMRHATKVAALWPMASTFFSPVQLVSYAFLHGSPTHLIFNMFGVWSFGAALESAFGSKRYALIYGTAILTAAAAQLITQQVQADMGPALGASGGVFGLLCAYAVAFPRERVVLIFPPIPMPAWVFATLYGAYELFAGASGWQTGTAHFAHLGGMLGGLWVLGGRKKTQARDVV
jgi:membrane associated rhomboid family serine protease